MRMFRKQWSKMLVFLVALAMLFSFLPMGSVFASDVTNVIIRVIGLDGSDNPQYWVEPTEITVPDGGINAPGSLGLDTNYTGMTNATVLNAMEYLAENWTTYRASGLGDLGDCSTKITGGTSAYLSEFNGLAEFDKGDNSGWMYFVNDAYVAESMGTKQLSQYDVVTVFYVKDYASSMYVYFDKDMLTLTNNKIEAQTESGDGAEVTLKTMAQSLNFSDLYSTKLTMSSGASLYKNGGSLSGSVDYDQGYVLADINESITTSTAAGVKASYSGGVQYIPAYFPFATADYQYDTYNDANSARNTLAATYGSTYVQANYYSGSWTILTDAYNELTGAGTIQTIIGAIKYYNRTVADLIGINDSKINRLGIETYGLNFGQIVSPTTYAYTFNNGTDPDEDFTLGFINPATTYSASITGGSAYVSTASNVVTAHDMTSGATYVITISTTVNGGGGTANYTITINKSSSTFGSPTAVKAYLPAPGQYVTGTGWGSISTDNANSLTNPAVVKLLGNPTGTGVSLGGFGGYVLCYYADGITDNASNTYGVDLIVYGNAFISGSTTWAEPGSVMVATGKTENGQIVPDQWYYIAGSEHYNNSTWDNDIVYTNNDPTNITYSLNGGASTQWTTSMGWWPKHAAKPTGENYGETSHPELVAGVSYTGDTTLGLSDLVKLPDNIYYQFGYCDVHADGNNYGIQANPYSATYATSYGDGIDLAWAVDINGNPVDMTGKVIKFVKVYTGDLGISMGEDSTEVLGMKKTTPEANPVGVTSAPTVKRNSTTTLTPTQISSTQYMYTDTRSPGNYTYSITSGAANIYMDNVKVSSPSSFNVTLTSGMTIYHRFIVQDGNQQPYIYILKLVC